MAHYTADGLIKSRTRGLVQEDKKIPNYRPTKAYNPKIRALTERNEFESRSLHVGLDSTKDYPHQGLK